MNFAQQAEQWIGQAQTRKRNPVSDGTAVAYKSLLQNHILPELGALGLSEVNNVTMKALVSKMSENGFCAQTITNTVGVVKMVVKSYTDAEGQILHPIKWNSDFMDLPTVEKASQNTPTVGGEALTEAISRAFGQFKALVAFGAGSGLRIGEILALRVGPEGWNPETGTVDVNRTLTVTGTIQNYTKTPAGMREVDLAPKLNDFLKGQIVHREGLMFRKANGEHLQYKTVARALARVNLPPPHSLRRFRATYLALKNVPDALSRFWLGHAAPGVHERYMKMGSEIQTRKDTAKAVGLGFEL